MHIDCSSFVYTSTVCHRTHPEGLSFPSVQVVESIMATLNGGTTRSTNSRTNSYASHSRSAHSRTPSRVEVLVNGNGHFVSPTILKGQHAIDPELLAMEESILPVAAAAAEDQAQAGAGEGSDADAEGSDEDAEGEAVDDDLGYDWGVERVRLRLTVKGRG